MWTESKKAALLFVLLTVCSAHAQPTRRFADSVRKAHHIPALCYAVVSSTQIIEAQTLGFKRLSPPLAAEPVDRFRIGSNTKAITGFVASLLVKQNKISWNTQFFDLFPELRSKGNKAYHHVTLLNLLSFRTRLYPYTYTYAEPKKELFTGDESQQRYQFAQWFFRQKPVPEDEDSVHFSNLGYIAAGLMLEKASGKTYRQLVVDMGNQVGASFYFGAPNTNDSLQTWGYDADLKPEPPSDNYKLSWLLAAGNINVSLPGYIKFIQQQLMGLKGQSNLLSAEEFNFLHYGLPEFSVGWFWRLDENGRLCSYNTGNPGTFLSKVYVYKNSDRAIILFSNAQTAETEAGLEILFQELYKKYMR